MRGRQINSGNVINNTSASGIKVSSAVAFAVVSVVLLVSLNAVLVTFGLYDAPTLASSLEQDLAENFFGSSDDSNEDHVSGSDSYDDFSGGTILVSEPKEDTKDGSSNSA